MNWRVPDADGRSIVSFSDAHSLRNLGREATAFQGPLTFDGLAAALKEERIAYTVEYYPEEGKYHATGHRACNVRYLPADTKAQGHVVSRLRSSAHCGRARARGSAGNTGRNFLIAYRMSERLPARTGTAARPSNVWSRLRRYWRKPLASASAPRRLHVPTRSSLMHSVQSSLCYWKLLLESDCGRRRRADS